MISHKLLILSSLPLFFSLSSAARTDLQKRLSPKGTTQTQLIEKNSLIRLWPLNRLNPDGGINIDDSVSLLNYYQTRQQKIFSRSVGVKPERCEYNRTFARFESGAIFSEESMLIKDILKKSSFSLTQQALHYGKRKQAKWDFDNGNYSALDTYTQLHSQDLIDEIARPEMQTAIANTTSLVAVTDKNSQKRLELGNSNYTIGGWFKPTLSGQGTVLFRKYFHDPNRPNSRQLEWEITHGGAEIHFLEIHDPHTFATTNYLSPEEADAFRNKNSLFYGKNNGKKDFLNDVVANFSKQKLNQSTPMASADTDVKGKKLTRVIVQTPVPHQGKKPVPEIPAHPGGPSFPPVDRIPTAPPTLRPGYLGYLSNGGKDVTIVLLQGLTDITGGGAWGGSNTNLGGCYGCVQREQDHDVWHFMAISVHLNDNLGPYMDIVVIRDPNVDIFGDKADMKSHYRTKRIELSRDMRSRPMMSPVAHGHLTETGCSKGSAEFCTRSELQIGSAEAKSAYNGFMRGLFMSKTALSEESILDIAAEFNPMDSGFCTYTKKPN